MLHRRQRLHCPFGVVASTVGVGVDASVSSQLVRATEAFRAPGKRAGMGLLAGVCADVPGLMLETMEGLIAERTFVGPWHFALPLLLLLLVGCCEAAIAGGLAEECCGGHELDRVWRRRRPGRGVRGGHIPRRTEGPCGVDGCF